MSNFNFINNLNSYTQQDSHHKKKIFMTSEFKKAIDEDRKRYKDRIPDDYSYDGRPIYRESKEELDEIKKIHDIEEAGKQREKEYRMQQEREHEEFERFKREQFEIERNEKEEQERRKKSLEKEIQLLQEEFLKKKKQADEAKKKAEETEKERIRELIKKNEADYLDAVKKKYSKR
tara:strand:- start:933 stop:1460 length:528 start_codon:yes stop_codon:yes gene_type:complete